MVQFQFLDSFHFGGTSIPYSIYSRMLYIYIYKYMRQFFFHESGVLIMFMVAYIKGIPW